MLKHILPLRPHRQHKHRVNLRHIAVQRHVRLWVRFRVMWRPEEIKVLPQTRRCALNPARRLGYVHAVLG